MTDRAAGRSERDKVRPGRLSGSGTAATVADSGKLAAKVAQAMEDDIIAAGWPVGSTIGSEAVLLDRYEVSRAVLREAIRLLEHHQMATMRRGPNGGLIVQAPAADAVVNAMVIFLEYGNTTVEDLSEARMILEPLTAGIAASRITEAGIAPLREQLGRESTHFARASHHLDTVEQLHLAIADLAGNPVLRLFVEVLARLTNTYAARPRRNKSQTSALGAEVHAAHAAIVDAIVSGNVAMAEHRTAVHLAALADWFRSRRARPLNANARPADVAGSKLAEITAWSIRADIVAEPHPVGTVIGSEPDLLKRYDVSRAVLREAIRLLEHHSVARMRRGPGGGLVVTAPDPSASVEAMALYLEYKKVSVPALREARLAVELACVDKVVARIEDPQVRAELMDALVLEETSRGIDIGPLSNELHLRLCHLSGNAVLSLFERVLLAVWSRHSTGTKSEPVPDVAQAVILAHDKIVEALLAGDAGLARHRMTRHLRATTEWWQ